MLGPLRVHDGGTWSPVRAPQQRAVLAILLIEAGRVVTTERLIDELWGEHPPRAAVGTVQGYVMRLRRLLGDAPGLLTRGRGYELQIGPDDLDVAMYDRLVDTGRRCLAEGRPAAAVGALAEALALWQGPALEDVPGGRTVSAEAARLAQSRLGALEGLLGARLDLGEHADVVDELRRLVAEHPLNEQLAAQHMLALYRCGRRAEALDAYQRTRRRLVDELGLEPGQPLRAMQTAILADDPALAPPAAPAVTIRTSGQGASAVKAEASLVPHQLPPDVANFTGREQCLADLDGLLPERGDLHPPVLVISTIAGTCGVGKTALAVRWAHRVADRFPDGQLHVNLRGYTAGPPLRPIDALARFLRALGVAPQEVPVDEEEAAALYRSRLAGRRMLLLLDNVNHPDQVRPLLPGGPGCVVVVTSRDQLSGLVARDGAVRLTLDVLNPTEALALLTRLIGERAGADPAALADLAELCGYLPLALRIAAAHLVTHPHGTIAEYTARLRGDPLNALQVDGDPHAAVRVALTHSYTALPADAQRMFRLLGLVPGPHFTAHAAAALANVPRTRAARLLDLLAAAHLVDEHAAGRYSFHDLLRRYAAEQAAIADSQPEREAALARLFDHYLHGVAAAAGHLYPELMRLPPPEGGGTAPESGASPDFDSHHQASAWLDAERPNLVAAVTHAAAHGPAAAAWRLADALRGYLYLRMHTVDWLTVARAGLAAAESDGDPRGLAASHVGLASVYWVWGLHEPAIEQFGRALVLAREGGWPEAESAILANLGNLHWALGDLDEAAGHYARAIALYRRTGQVASRATVLGNLGLVHLGLGDLEPATERLTAALALHQETGSRAGEARTLTHLGEAYHAAGRGDDALATLCRALDVVRAIGDRNLEGDTLRNLAAVHRDAGRHAEALECATAAMGLALDTGYRRLEAGARTTLASIHHQLGRAEPAIQGHRAAIAIAREVGNRYLEAEARIGLAAAFRGSGAPQRAAEEARAALDGARRGRFGLLAAQAEELLAAIEAAAVT